MLEDEKSKTLVTWPGRCSSIVLLFEKYYEIFLEFLRETSLVKSRRISEAYAGLPSRYTRVSTGVLNFRASLYRDQFQYFGPYWYLNF